jgi:hypothetical protein
VTDGHRNETGHPSRAADQRAYEIEYVVRPGRWVHFYAIFGLVAFVPSLIVFVPLIATSGQPAQAAIAALWLAFLISLMYGLARTRATITRTGEVLVRNWYRTRRIRGYDIVRVDVGKGFLSPLHRSVQLHLVDDSDVRVFASDRMLLARRDLPSIASQFDRARASS